MLAEGWPSLRKNQKEILEIKNAVNRNKKCLYRLTRGLDKAQGRISVLEDMSSEIPQTNIKEKKDFKKLRTVLKKHGAISHNV